MKAATVFITAPLADSKTDSLISLPTISVTTDSPDLTYLNPVRAVYSVPSFQSRLTSDEAIPVIFESTFRATEHNCQEFIFGATFDVSAVSSSCLLVSSFSAGYSNQLVYETPGLVESRIQGPVVSVCEDKTP